jgi:hypothetical protein
LTKLLVTFVHRYSAAFGLVLPQLSDVDTPGLDVVGGPAEEAGIDAVVSRYIDGETRAVELRVRE